MGRQGTITSFFRPASASGNSKPSNSSHSKKRPRPVTGSSAESMKSGKEKEPSSIKKTKKEEQTKKNSPASDNDNFVKDKEALEKDKGLDDEKSNEQKDVEESDEEVIVKRVRKRKARRIVEDDEMDIEEQQESGADTAGNGERAVSKNENTEEATEKAPETKSCRSADTTKVTVESEKHSELSGGDDAAEDSKEITECKTEANSEMLAGKTGSGSKSSKLDDQHASTGLKGQTKAVGKKKPKKKNVKPFSFQTKIEDNADEDDVPSEDDKRPGLDRAAEPSIKNTRLSTPRTWKDGKPVPYKFLADAFCKVEEISGRLEIQAILCELFRNIISSTPEDLVPSIYLCINKLAPAHEGIELGIGESILIKALSQVSGRTVPALKNLYKQKGDLGDVAAAARTKQKTMFPPPPLTVRKVYEEFRAIAQSTGKNSQDTKRAKIVKMLVAASKSESKYISRALLGKLRIHLADKTVIAALSAAMVGRELGIPADFLLTNDGKKKNKMTRKEENIEEALKEAGTTLAAVYSQLPVWDIIIPKLLELKKIDERLLEQCKLIPGIPVSPMLAKPTKAISEVLEKFAETSFTCEFKYDGERAQVHRMEDGTVKIYSRNAENLTPKYPDLVKKLPGALLEKCKDASFIIDAEAVAYDTEKKQILPFQELQSRKRKDVDEKDIKVRVCIFAFDLIYFDGKSLLEESLEQRRVKLQDSFEEQEGQFMFAKGHDSRDPEQIMELLNLSIKAGCEGLMVKALVGESSTYEPANRSQNWLKVKKDYLEGCGDSLDLVPIGGYIGRGKRTGIYGAFLLACYDPDNEEYQSICKIGTGFTEEDLNDFAKFYNDAEAERTCKVVKSYYKTPELKALQPDVWFEPVQVWEVKCADLSISPQHMAAVGHVNEEKGIALRFPRFIRLREDKKPEEATNAEQVAEFYLRQSSVANNS